MRNRQDYGHALQVVGGFVSEWDPCSLLSGGAPRDEYSAEVAKLVTHIPRITSPGAAAQALSVVFSQAFQPEGFSVIQCSEAGSLLYHRLSSAALLVRG
jgi:hypothetical protein